MSKLSLAILTQDIFTQIYNYSNPLKTQQVPRGALWMNCKNVPNGAHWEETQYVYILYMSVCVCVVIETDTDASVTGTGADLRQA